MNSNSLFTVFIPAYNRADVLERTLKSISESLHREVEVIVVDDGSTDGTSKVVAEARSTLPFPLTYIYQENSGKAGAHNTALSYARGEFFVTLDAGDLLLPDGLMIFLEEWNTIPPGKRGEYAGVSALCLNDEGRISGKEFPENLRDGTFLDLVSLGPVAGEKRQAIRTEIMRQFPYPRLPGEKHIRPSLILLRMAHRFRLRFVNKAVQQNIREKDGISANIQRYRAENPQGFRLFHLEEITVNSPWYTKRKIYADSWRFIRYSLHSGVPLKAQAGEVRHKLIWLTALPIGVLKWLGDRIHSPE